MSRTKNAEVVPVSLRHVKPGMPMDKRDPGHHHKGEEVRVTQDRARALELRKMGLSYRVIAERMGISVERAHSHVQTELIFLRNKTTLDTESVREMELMRLDEITASLWPKVKRGDASAVMAVLKGMERRAKLLGLDAPVKAAIIGAIANLTPEQVATMSNEEIQEHVKRLATMAMVTIPQDAESDDESE